jgi:molecular chaperone GrpE
MFGKKYREDQHEQQPRSDSGDARADGADDQTGDGGEPNVPDAMAYDKLVNDLAVVALERDQARADYLRALAEYQNYQRRALQNEQEAKRQGVTSVLSSILPVIDHFDMALTQRPDSQASQRMLEGVQAIKNELIRALERYGVAVINPALGEEPDHARHSVLMHKPEDGVEAGRISGVMQVGYTLDGRIVRPAMVTVAPEQQEPAADAGEPVSA